MNNKLNGWQRLWIVSSIVWLVFVAILVFNSIPTSKKVYKEWSYSTIEWAIQNDPKLTNQSVSSIRNVYSDMQDKELIQKVQQKYIEQNPFNKFDFEKINKDYQFRIGNMKVLQAKSIGVGVLIWIGPMVLIYLFGWSIGWIYRGFRKA